VADILRNAGAYITAAAARYKRRVCLIEIDGIGILRISIDA